MRKWISKIFNGYSVELPNGVPEAWVEQLEFSFRAIENLPGAGRQGLAQDLLTYVLHGEAAAVLSEIGKRPEFAGYLRLSASYFNLQEQKLRLSALYANFAAVPAPIALRWALLLDASVPAAARHYIMQFPGSVNWPETLFLHSIGCCIGGYGSALVVKEVSVQLFEPILIEAGLDGAALLVSAFASPVNTAYGTEKRLQRVAELAGYADALEQHIEKIRPLLQPELVEQRLHVLTLLEKARPETLEKLAAELAQLAVASSKQVRAAAEALIKICSAKITPPLEYIACNGKSEQRVLALKLLYSLALKFADERLQAFVRNTAQADKASSVTALIEEWGAQQSALNADIQQTYDYTVPAINWSTPITPELSALLDRMWEEINDSIAKANKQFLDNHNRWRAQGHQSTLHQIEAYSKQAFSALCNFLAADPPENKTPLDRRAAAGNYAAPALNRLASSEYVSPQTLFKLLVFFDLFTGRENLLSHPACSAFNTMHRATGRPTLLELSELLVANGLPGTSLLHNYCYPWGDPIACDWPDEAVWPYFAHYLQEVIKTLMSGSVNNYTFSRAALFRAISLLPYTPATVVTALFELALGTAKSERRAAQDALLNYPGKETRIIAALADGKSDVRTVAAQWLGRLREYSAIPALEAAVAKEKQDIPKGAMLDALQMLGQPVEKYLNRQALAAEASKSLSKGVPKELEWFPWNALPEVRWDDNNEQVPVDVLRWMLVQAVKQKSAEPNAILRKYCAMFEPRSRQILGQMILDSWLCEDTRPISPEQAMQGARTQAQNTHKFMASNPQYFKNDPNLGRSVEELTALYFTGFSRQPAGSAIGSKGLLGVVATCATEGVVAPTQRYLKEWYGSRAAQGKALIAMLAWVEHPSATQLMLAIGNRFRTKSFQEEATKQAQALAERKGWTLSELADRTIPSAGFDESGVLELSYGLRKFSARLLADFKIELYNPDGKKIAALPDPRQDDDAELARDAKKAFSASKKEIKTIVALQTDRLYEALCTERDWSFEDWNLYLNQHPVARHLVQRLVWVQIQDGTLVGTFRPLDDGTLTDCDDNEVQLPSEARVRIAHDSLLAQEEISAWQRHLADYAITPLFQQLGKGVYQLPEDKAKADTITDFQGFLLEAFALRGRALKLGYTRGVAEDGGWFYLYEKRFPTLGLQAVIEFTGNPLPEENRTVALLNLHFLPTSNTTGWQNTKLPLFKVPKVLLSECYNDLRLIAAEGVGFDPDWQKKSGY